MMTPQRADDSSELASIRASLATVSDHITPLTTAAHNVLQFAGNAEAHGYWDDEARTAAAHADNLVTYLGHMLDAARAIQDIARRL